MCVLSFYEHADAKTSAGCLNTLPPQPVPSRFPRHTLPLPAHIFVDSPDSFDINKVANNVLYRGASGWSVRLDASSKAGFAGMDGSFLVDQAYCEHADGE